MEEDEYRRSAEALLKGMQAREGEWRWLREHINPQSMAAQDNSDQPRSGRENRKICFAAWQASMNLAGAHCMYIMPPGQRWFAFRSAMKRRKENGTDYEAWFNFCTDVTHAELSRSNFYTVNQQAMIERVQLGTGCYYIGLKGDGTLGFIYVPCGTYGIGEDEYRTVNKIARVFKLTPEQAEGKWGYESLTEGARALYDQPETRYTEQQEYLHLVIPNPEAEFGTSTRKYVTEPRKRKFLSVYMSWGEGRKEVLEVGGYDEFPYFVTRFLPDGTSAYGIAPGSAAASEMRRCENLEKVMDVLGETAAMPRLLMLETQVGDIDLRAGGRTVVRRADAALGYPREWGTSGRYDIGRDRIEDKEGKIREAFFEPMLNIFSGVERQMTATEVAARQEEKVIAFAPSFTLLMADINNLLLRRVFSLLFQAGKFDNGKGYPSEIIERDVRLTPTGEPSGRIELRLPEVSYNSKIAQSIERVQVNGASQYVAQALEVTQATGDAAMLDIVDLAAYGRDMYNALGGPASCMRDEVEVKRRRVQREEAQAAAAAAQAQAAQAAAAKDNAAAVGALTKAQ